MRYQVTYELITPESAEQEDAADRGYYGRDLTLRQAAEDISGAEGGYDPDSWPISRQSPPRWITGYRITEDYGSGAVENRSLHIPPGVTPRLFGIRASRTYGGLAP